MLTKMSIMFNQIYIYICVCVSICIYIFFVCVYMYERFFFVCVCVCIYMYISFVCMYIYIYIYIYILYAFVCVYKYIVYVCFYLCVCACIFYVFVNVLLSVYVCTSACNKFPDFFFVWALSLIVDTWNSSSLRSNLLRLQCTCTVPTTSGRPRGSPFLCERVIDLRHGLFHLLNCLITTTSELRE